VEATVPSELPKVFQPSTMASRRTERAARGELERPRRLISLGWHREVIDGLGTNDKRTARKFEMMFDADRPADVFIRLAVGGPLTPLVQRRYDDRPRLIDKGRIPARARPSGHYPPAGRPNEVIRIGGDDD
jgi:hypothetical protein